MRRWHVLIYVILILYNIIFAIVLQNAYTSGADPVTVPGLGFFYIPRDMLPVPILAAVILSFWSAVNLYGVATVAVWGSQTRTWGVIIALMFVFPFYASLYNLPLALAVLEPSLAYCALEGSVAITAPRYYGEDFL